MGKLSAVCFLPVCDLFSAAFLYACLLLTQEERETRVIGDRMSLKKAVLLGDWRIKEAAGVSPAHDALHLRPATFQPTGRSCWGPC